MADFRNFNINGVDASIALATSTENGLMSSDSYNEIENITLELDNKVPKSNDYETILSDDSKSFIIVDESGNVVITIDENGASLQKLIIKDSSGNILQTIDENITKDDETLCITDSLGNVALKVDSTGVSYYGKVNKSDIPSISSISNTVDSNNYFPTDINMVINFGQSNSLNGNNPTPKYDFEDALIFNGSTGTGRMYFAGGVIDNKTDEELDSVFGGGFISLQDYTGSLNSIGGGIYEYMKAIKEENNIDTYEDLGFQFIGATCGQVQPISVLSDINDVYYQRILTCVTYAKKYANALGKSFSVSYLTYIEGEYDSSSDEKYFHDMLWVFFSNIEHDIKAITNQDNDIVFMTYQVGQFVKTFDSSTIYQGVTGLVSLTTETGDGTGYTLDDTAQTYLQDGVSLIDRSKIYFSCPFYFLASYETYVEGSANPIHLNKDLGIFNIFGAYQGLQAKRCLTDGYPLSTLYPLNHNIMDNGDGTYTTTVEFEVPVPPLQFKQYDSSLGNSESQTVQEDGYEPNYGFQLTATEYSNVFVDIITSVRIKRMKYVEIKTSVDPTGLYLTYAHKGWLSGGNLCDSQGNYNEVEIGNNTFPLDNWCPVFDYLLN